jgi:restriction endonuclease S subunit
MPDRDLVRLYGVETRALNQAVRRKIDRFPEDLMFRLTRDEIKRISQFVISSRHPGGETLKFSKNVVVFKTGLITENYPRCTFESKNMRLRVNRETVIPEFVAIVLDSRHTKAYYREALKQRCGMATLNQGHVLGIPLPFPQLPDQKHIVAYLDDLIPKIDVLEKFQAQAAAELEALLPSILDKAFKGEL